MSEVNVEKKSSGNREPQGSRDLQRRQDQGVAGRGEFSSPFWRDPLDLFTMSPFTLMRRFSEDMDRAFSGGASGFGGLWSPAIEVSEREGKMIVHADLPGLNKEEVKVDVTDDSLTIQGERKREHEEKGQGFRRSERSYGSFYRSIPLPQGANTEEARAKFENGVLEISIPVPAAQQRSRSISIESGGPEKRQPASAGSAAQERDTKAG
ncbi:MAG TPA: hypothetical protein DEQ47_20155 [Solibacterales bacterium]|nr:hypothetical protein [Bryobacterales bacterium]